MSHGRSSDEIVRETHNTARFFTEHRHISWVLLVGVLLWGTYGYLAMPKRKDPEIPIRAAVAVATWPGASAEAVEARVTRVVEDTIASSSRVERIESTSRASVAVVTIFLDESVTDAAKVFDDLWLKLDNIKGLPEGAKVEFVKDFGDTAALLFSVSSPKASEIEVQLRAERIAAAITDARRDLPAGTQRAALISCYPFSLDPSELRVIGAELAEWATQRGAKDVRLLAGRGFLGIDATTVASDEKIIANALEFALARLRASEIHPDQWRFAVVRDPAETEKKLAAVAGDKYSHRDLDRYSEQLAKALEAVPQVAKVTRSGVVADVIYLDYSQERISAYGLVPAQIEAALAQRNIVARGGIMELERKSVLIAPAGELGGEDEIGAVVVAWSATGSPIYLRDVATVRRGYESPSYLSFSTWRDGGGDWQRTRSIAVAVNMKSGLQIADFGVAVEGRIAGVRSLLPEDLVIARVSDQPQQVRENVSLFMSSLYEAIILVVLVALIGFWEWRSALLMALSIPITLAMTFGIMHLLGLDLQQVSIASLIIALGLLVDDPVVAGDAIKRELNQGQPRLIAAWLGPTKLAAAILFATITNIVAYLPFLTLPGDTGRFIFSLPVVLTCSLVASRLVSMTFIPLLGYYLLRPSRKPEPPPELRRRQGFARLYHGGVGWAIRHRFIALGAAVGLLFAGCGIVRGVKQAFFPIDLSYLSYIDVWLPEDAPLSTTQQTAEIVDTIARELLRPHGLQSLTTFVGGGSPRFWLSIAPEQRQANYATVIVRLADKHETAKVATMLQDALSSRVPGARVDVRQLESGPPVGVPVSIRIAGQDPDTLRGLADQVAGLIQAMPLAERARDSWGADNIVVNLRVDPDRAGLAGVTNLDVARSSGTALNGAAVGVLHEGDHEVPIVLRLRASERQRLSDLGNLYVYSSQRADRVPLRQIADLELSAVTGKILRRNHVRTITVGAFPVAGALASEVLAGINPGLEALREKLPPGYTITVGGEQEEQQKSFASLVLVLVMSVGSIYLALVVQFRNAVKPLVVFAAIPFGVVGALASLRVMDAAFGFMAFLGVISLIGVIVSHIIVLFDFIEERRIEGAPLEEALLDAGIQRLRPVLVTVGATVLGLFPLALHGGPLWEPLCYVQIGGLTLATVITLVLVPVLYAIFVRDLRIIDWPTPSAAPPPPVEWPVLAQGGSARGSD